MSKDGLKGLRAAILGQPVESDVYGKGVFPTLVKIETKPIYEFVTSIYNVLGAGIGLLLIPVDDQYRNRRKVVFSRSGVLRGQTGWSESKGLQYSQIPHDEGRIGSENRSAVGSTRRGPLHIHRSISQKVPPRRITPTHQCHSARYERGRATTPSTHLSRQAYQCCGGLR